jgi:hypothetical protein
MESEAVAQKLRVLEERLAMPVSTIRTGPNSADSVCTGQGKGVGELR